MASKTAPKMVSRSGPGGLENGPGPRISPRMAKMAPKIALDAPRIPKMPPRQPEDNPRLCEMAPIWPQDGPRWAKMPSWSLLGSSLVLPGVVLELHGVTLGVCWSPWRHLGSLLGPRSFLEFFGAPHRSSPSLVAFLMFACLLSLGGNRQAVGKSTLTPTITPKTLPNTPFS